MNVKILIVDDQKANILALEKLLEQDDVTFLKADSGQAALSLILEHEIALALVDVHMPNMGGIELAQLMRGSQVSKSIPIIFVTAHSPDEGLIFEGYEKGAVDFLQKPLVKPIVRSKVQTFIDLHRTQKRLQEQVEQAAKLKELADQANKAKSRFLANMSHDIRTPLNAILGYAQLIKQDPTCSKEQYGDFASLIMRNGRLLATLLDDVLDLSKIEANCLKVAPETVDLPSILQTIRNTFSPQAQAKGLEFRLILSPDLPRMVTTDPIRLQQILNNLVGNAIKFTGRGHVFLRIDYGDGHLQIEVEDTGAGIATEARTKIFKPFEQANLGRKEGGTGLGLTISAELARALGGQLFLQSTELGVGSVFAVDIPCEPSSGKHDETVDESPVKCDAEPMAVPRAGASKAPNFTDLNILVVDDAWENRDILEHFLRLAGANVRSAADGVECLELLEEADPFDLIFLDLEMPKLDGLATIKRLRQRHAKVPVVALTAHAMQEVRDNCLDAGFTGYMTKPIKLPELYGLISQLT